jgi:hypothetical protein
MKIEAAFRSPAVYLGKHRHRCTHRSIHQWWFPSWLEWMPQLNVEGAVHHLVPQPVPVVADEVYAAGD